MKLSSTTGLVYFVHTRCSAILSHARVLCVFALIAAIIPIQALAQNAPKLIYLSEHSSFEAKDLVKLLQKECPNTSFTTDNSKNDYVLEARTGKSTSAPTQDDIPPDVQTTNDLVLFDRDHLLVRASSTSNLGNALKDICHAIKNVILIQVVDSQTTTESLDVRGVPGGPGVAGAVGSIVNDTTGRRTHTDNSLLYVTANGENALLDCYERRKGCTPIGNGKYYAEFDGESIWVDFRMPLIHAYVRNHYVVAGGW
jgi:hypothetical protein